MKIVTTFFLLFMFSFSFSQNSIEGIGKFKLKKTTIEQLNEIASVAKMDKMKIIGASNIYYSKYTKPVLVEVMLDSVNMNENLPYSMCQGVSIYYIPSISIADIKIQKLLLIFYNDTLVRLQLEHSKEIEAALDLKYGTGKTNTATYNVNINCKYNFKDTTYSVIDTTIKKSWQNEDIECYFYQNIFHYNCKKMNDYGKIEIVLSSLCKNILKCHERAKEAIEEKKKILEKKKLDDF